MTPDNARTQRRQGEALAAYLQMVRDAGPAGIDLHDIAKHFGLVRTQSVRVALEPALQAGTVCRRRPRPGVASRVWMAEFKPEDEKLEPPKRERKSRATGRGQPRPAQNLYLADAKAAGANGITVDGQVAKHKVRPSTAACVIRELSKRGELVARTCGSGKGHGRKTYFLPELAPDVDVLMKPPARSGEDSRAPKLAKDAPAITPDGVKFTRAEPLVDRRFTVENPQRGWINPAECRPWAAGVAR